MDPAIKRAIAAISESAWEPIKYTEAIFDEHTRRWISRAEVAEIDYTAFTSKKKSQHIPGRLVVRRIPEANPKKHTGQGALFDTWRFHAFFTTSSSEERDTVAADQVHRAHAIIENVHADLKAGPLAHLPSVIWSGARGVHDVHKGAIRPAGHVVDA